MKMSKKLFALLLTIVMVVVPFAACSSSTDEKESGKKKIALVVNQKFGDQGPSDEMKAGLIRAAEELDYDYITYESSPDTFEDDIRSYAESGYELIVTSFADMQEATKAVAADFPDVAFFGCFQAIDGIENICTSTYRGQESLYYVGVLASMMSDNGKIGFIGGMEEPSTNAEANAFMEGVHAADPEAEVEFVYIGSFEDTAAAKAAAETMIADGCDVVQTNAGTCRLGAYEACVEKGVLSCGDTSSVQADKYPNTVYSVSLVDFATDVYNAVINYSKGTLELGSAINVGYDDGVYAIDYEVLDAFKAANSEHADKIDEFLKYMETADEEVEYNTDTPSWSVISGK